jgi:hypothetical protein
MITVNSLSGGQTSSYIAMKYKADYNVFSLVCLDDYNCKPKDKSIIDYVNNKLSSFSSQYGEFVATAEDDKTLYAMRDLEQLLGTEIIWVRGDSFDKVIDLRYQRVLLGNSFRLPSWARRYCTTEMKLEPIFQWWFKEIGEKVNMRIGFRMDEYDRMERFFNNSDPKNYKIPIASKLTGQKRQVHETFNWRYCSFPLVKDKIIKQDIVDYWKNNGYLGGDLFNELRQIEFPVVSNCIGCFHKKVETLASMAHLHPEKMEWFSQQEKKNMGVWLDSRQTYEDIIENKKELAKEYLYEIVNLKHSCDSGGCTE